MFRPTRISKSPREHFKRAVDEEFSKFERKERAFRQLNATSVQQNCGCLSIATNRTF
jgi:hypothetical protein